LLSFFPWTKKLIFDSIRCESKVDKSGSVTR
jgi:hypothetical protein